MTLPIEGQTDKEKLLEKKAQKDKKEERPYTRRRKALAKMKKRL